MKYPKLVFLQPEGVMAMEADGLLRAVVEQDLPLLRYTIGEEKDFYSKSPAYLAYLAKLNKKVDRAINIDSLMSAFRTVLQDTRNDSDSYDSSRRMRMLAETAFAVLGL